MPPQFPGSQANPSYLRYEYSAEVGLEGQNIRVLYFTRFKAYKSQQFNLVKIWIN
jgi:hypothetical protein